MVTLLTRQLNQIPSFVVFIDSKDASMPNYWGYQPGLWVKYIPGRRDVSLTCPGSGHVLTGVWHDLHSSLGHMHSVCNMNNRPLRIAYNIWQPYFAVEDGMLDTATLENIFLETLLEAHNLLPIWVNAGQSWGGKDKNTGVWNGAVGLVNIKDICKQFKMNHSGWI